MILHHNLHKNNKGIGTIFGMVFFLLIVMVVFASFVIVLTQNTGLEQTTMQAKQLDLDRYTELQTVSIANPETAVLNNRAYILCDITNNGTLPSEFIRLWIRDISNNTVGNILLSPSLVIQPGTSTEYFKSCNVLNASTYDQFSFWFVTTRGNLISAYPNINQFSNISTIGASSGQNSGFANNTTPIQLYVNPTKPNDLIYMAVAFDDGNTLNPPASTPTMNWVTRTTSDATDHYSHGDALLRTYYAFSPGGPINITLTVSGTENDDYYWAAVAFAISNVNRANPFDSSGPETSIGSSSPAHDTIKISSSNELAIGAFEIDTLTPNITPGAGFTQVLNPQITVGATGDSDAFPRSVWVETSFIQNPTNSLPVNCTYIASGRPWAIIVDAVNLVITPPVVPVSLSPSSGPTGQPVTVSGGGFAPNSHLIATFDGIQVPFSFSTDNFGNIQSGANFTVPIGSSAGNKTVTIIDTQFNYATANFIVTTPNITLTPNIGSVGNAVTVTGSNFIDNSTININFNGNPTATNPPIISANANGGFLATFVVSGTAGNKTVLASDGVNSVLSNFTVIPSISVTPTRGLNGTQVSLSGQGFAAQSNLQVAFDGNGVSLSGNPSTDSTGSFINLNFTAQSSSLGVKSINVTDASGNFDDDSFKLVTLDHFNIAGNPSSLTAGQSFGSNSVTITACDVDNYILGGYAGQVYFSSSDSQATLPYTFSNIYNFTTDDNGIHTFAGSDFVFKTAGSEILTVTDGVKSNSTTIVVNPAALDHFAFNNVNSPKVAGTGFSITIAAKDAYENTVTSYTTAGTLSDLSGSITPTASGAFVSGVRTVTVTITKTYTDDAISISASAKSGTSNAFTVNPGVIHHFTMTGLPSSVTAGQVFGNVVVTAYDINNNVKTDYAGQVYFTSSDGAAVLPFTSGSKYTFTSGSGLDNGVHSFGGFALKTAGSRTITVTDGVTSLTSSAITVGFAPVVDHFLVAGFTDPVVAGAAGSVTVTAKDLYENTVTSYVGTVHVTSSDGAATLPANHALAGGVYTFTNGVTLRTTVDQSISATDTATGLITGSQTGITVNPGAISSFAIAGYPSSVAAGSSFGGVVVTAYDAFGNVKTDFTGQVYFTSSDGAAVLPYLTGSRYTFVSGDQGDHIFAGFTLKTVAGGAKTITVTDGTRSATSTGITVVPGGVDRFTFAGLPASVTAGSSFAGSVTVTAYDSSNNVKTDYVGSVYFTSSDAQAVLPFTVGAQYTFLSSENGVHAFAGSGFTLKTTPSQTITVRDDAASKTSTSSAITVNSGVLDHFTFNNVNSPKVAGTGFSITITAKDAYENTVTSYTTAGTLSDLSGSITPTASGAFVSGVRTVTVTITKTYTDDSISISASAKSGTSNAFTVNPGVIHHFTMTGLPASVVAGQVFGNVVVTAYDINNNVKTDYAGQVYFTSTDGAAVLPYLTGSRYTFVGGDQGVHTFSGFTLKTAGSRTITVSDGTLSLTSGAITVNFASIDHFAVTGFPNPVLTGTAGSVTVTAQDLYGNTVTTYVGTVHITSSDGAATLPANHALAGGVYTFTNGVTLKTKGTQSITVTDTVTSSLTGSQSGIIVYNQVTFVSAGTADASEGGANDPTPSYPTGLQANDLLLLQVTVSDISTTPLTPAGFTVLSVGPDSNGQERQWIYYKFSTGSESGTLTVSVGGTVMSMAQMYAFRNVAAPVFFESGGFGSGADTTIEGQTVTTTGNGRLALSFVFIDNNKAVGNLAGASGGYNWVEVTNGEFQYNGGTDGTIELQSATMATSGTISGGVATVTGSDSWGVRAFALIPN